MFAVYMMYMEKDEESLYLKACLTEAQARCAALIWLIEKNYLFTRNIEL